MKGCDTVIFTASSGPHTGPEKLRHYLQAKHNADEHLKNSGLNYTIVRLAR